MVGRDATLLEQANLFIDFTFAQIAKSVAAGKVAILEFPATLWHLRSIFLEVGFSPLFFRGEKVSFWR